MGEYIQIIFGLIILVAVIFFIIWKRSQEFGSGWTELEGKKVAIKDKELSCTHCGCKNFRKMEGKITTSLMMLFQLGFLNRSAACFTCSNCGLVQWFLSCKEKVFREFDRDEF